MVHADGWKSDIVSALLRVLAGRLARQLAEIEHQERSGTLSGPEVERLASFILDEIDALFGLWLDRQIEEMGGDTREIRMSLVNKSFQAANPENGSLEILDRWKKGYNRATILLFTRGDSETQKIARRMANQAFLRSNPEQWVVENIHKF